MVSITLDCITIKIIRLGKNMISALAAVIPCVMVALPVEKVVM